MDLRSIRFKAKRLDNGEWIIGNFVVMKIPALSKTTIGIVAAGGATLHEVDPATVCMFTGLKDCKGNEIWENDVIELRTGTQLIVMWDTNSCRFSLHKRGCGDVTFPFCKTTAKDFKVIKSKFDKEK